jgi:sigma-B regulation protein RsbU (phosphoserine phosphatase)
MSVTELIGAAVGSTLLTLGIASSVAWSLRRQSSDRILLFFGIWCSLYGIRLIGLQSFVRAVLGGSPRSWGFLTVLVTYAINVPGGLFIESLVGPGWKGSVRRTWQVFAVYAVVAVVTDLLLRRPGAAMGPNSPIVLAAMIVWLGNLWRYRQRLTPIFATRGIAVGGIVLVLFVINQNTGRPVWPTINLEPVGVFVFMACLGYGVVGSVLRREAELVAMHRELDTARHIQTALLPRELPSVPRIDIAVQYLPMTAVAGDLYDFVLLGPERFGILVADVTGHGIPAALVASMVKVAFSSQAANAHDPASVLSGMNGILCGNMERTYVTAIYAVVDSGQGTISYANAGHPPLLVRRSDACVEGSNEHGFMLGLSTEAAYTTGRLDLRLGDCILMFTDGVSDTQDKRGNFVDLEGIKAWATAHGDNAAPHVAYSMVQWLREWRGAATFDDDLTLVVARFAER